jgi:eukaryotic-like serine/threonine-protein kinase
MAGRILICFGYVFSIIESVHEPVKWVHSNLVMPFIRRGTLQNILQQQRHFLELKEISSYLEHICAALEYAHENGVVHLDLKPLNLLVRDDGGLLLADFGLAHLMKQGTVEGGSSLLVGSPHYMAPEHIQGHPEKRSDLFSLGVILYQMLIGRLPFEGSTPEAIISKNLTEWPTAPRLLRPDLPPAVEEVVGKALAKQPASRYQTASELFAAFKKAILASAQLPFAGSSYIVPEKPSVPYPAHNEEVSHQNYPVSNVGNPMGKTIVSYQEHREKVMSLAWSPDGRRIASAAQGIVQVWEPLSGRTIYTHKDKAFFPQYIYGVAWSPNSTHLVSGCADKTLQVWDANKGNLVTTYKGHTKGISCVAWSPDGTRIVSGSVDKTAQVWNATSGQHILTFANHSGLLGILGVSAVAWSPDGRRITSCGNDSHVKVWDASDGSGIYSYDEHKGTIYGLAWSPDSSRIASCSHDLTIQVWVADTGSYRVVCRGHTQRVNAVAFSPDGRYLASACEDNTVRLWSSETGKNLFIYEGHTKNVHTLAWSPDGKYIASGGDDKIVQVWASGMS